VAFSLLPLAPGKRRKTLQQVIVPGKVWTHDQIQGVVNVNVPVRETVVKLAGGGGGLWVHNPVAPTKEHLAMVRALEAEHGPVKHIVLGTVALEHKALAGPFAAAFPDAEVWLQPGQWSFPIHIPAPLFGFPLGAKTLPTPADDAVGRRPPVPWRDEIDFEVLGPLRFKSVGTFSESAFVHKATGTLIVTDAVVKIEDSPPAILAEDPRALLFHARDQADSEVSNDAATRARGWRRIVLFGLIFFPADIEVASVGEALRAARRVPEASKLLGEGAVPLNLYPWRWSRDDRPAFEALQKSGGNRAGLVVAPILQKLILNREPAVVLEWVERVSSKHKFTRVIPCHLANDVRASPSDFKAAFDFLRCAAEKLDQRQKDGTSGGAKGGEHSAPSGGSIAELARWPFGARPAAPKARAAAARAEDLKLLSEASELLERLGVVAPAKV